MAMQLVTVPTPDGHGSGYMTSVVLQNLINYIYISLTSYSVLSPSQFILARLQSCVLSTFVLIMKRT